MCLEARSLTATSSQLFWRCERGRSTAAETLIGRNHPRRATLARGKQRTDCSPWLKPGGSQSEGFSFTPVMGFSTSQGSVLGIERAVTAWKLWGADCLLRSVPSQKVANGVALPPFRARDVRQSDSTGIGSGHRRKAASKWKRRAPEADSRARTGAPLSPDGGLHLGT
jgi:hypothetical protein